MSDIDTAVVVDSLKVLDSKWPIREEKQTLDGRCGLTSQLRERLWARAAPFPPAASYWE